MLLSMSPCVAKGRSSERTLGARIGLGASRRAPSEPAPMEAAPIEPSLAAITVMGTYCQLKSIMSFSQLQFIIRWHTRNLRSWLVFTILKTAVHSFYNRKKSEMCYGLSALQ